MHWKRKEKDEPVPDQNANANTNTNLELLAMKHRLSMVHKENEKMKSELLKYSDYEELKNKADEMDRFVLFENDIDELNAMLKQKQKDLYINTKQYTQTIMMLTKHNKINML